MIQPICQPIAVKTASGQRFGPISHRTRCPCKRFQRRKPSGPGIGILKHNLARRVCQSHHGHRTASARGLVDQGACALCPARPIAGIGPAAIDHDQQGTGAFNLCIRVQNRPCKPDNRRRHSQRAQQQQPPRGFIGFAGLIRQAQQQRNTRKPPFDRRGRDGAQQQPQDWQGDQAQQHPRRGKGHGSKHHRPPSRAA